MADCGDLLTNQDLSNAKKDATTMNDFVESNQDSIVSKKGKTIRTLEGINNDAQDAIDSFKLKSKGQYLPDPITLNDGFEYVVYLDKTYFAASPPYTTDPVTYPTPDLDTVNLIEQSYLTRSFGEKIAGDGDSQLAGGPIWPLSSQDSLSLGAQSTVVDIDADRFRVNTGSEVELLYLWEPSGTLPSAPFTITNIVANTTEGYDFTIDSIVYEFVTSLIYDKRIQLLIGGYGSDPSGASASTESIKLGKRINVEGTYSCAFNSDSIDEFVLVGQKKTAYRLNATADNDTVLNINGNNHKVSGVQISASGFENVIGFAFSPNGETTTKFANIQDMTIGGCEIGLQIVDGSYNYFSDINFISNVFGLTIAEFGETGFRGAMTFNHLYFPSGTYAISNYTNNNTVTTYNSAIIEGHYRCILNYGKLEFNDCYFGDGDRYSYTGSESGDTSTYKGYPGSFCRFNRGNGLSGANPHNYGDGRITAQIELLGNATSGAEIEVVDCAVDITNQNQAAYPVGRGRQFAYKSSSNLDRIRFDNVPNVKPTINDIDNQAPILYHAGYTPLYSLSPKSNYIVNGTFSDQRLNAEFVSGESLGLPGSASVAFDSTWMNQYGGDVMVMSNAFGPRIRFSIPEKYLNKRMALVYWCTDVGQFSTSGGIDFNDSDISRDDGQAGQYFFFQGPSDKYNVAGRTPYRAYIYVTPTKTNGSIRLYFNQSGGVGTVSLGSVILTEQDNLTLLDQFVDVSNQPSTRGTTANRPQVPIKQEIYFDETLGYNVTWNGTQWVDSTGSPA